MLANTHWNLASFLILALSGLLALGLGILAGYLLWNRQQRRIRLVDSENERLVREAVALERRCREVEAKA